MGCDCYHCVSELEVRDPSPNPLMGRLNRMFLCALCGNKRCPHAADHRNACTASNEPGQPGSLYENARVSGSPTPTIEAEITRLEEKGW